MKHTLTLFYSVQNGGDGSAYPYWMESQELADFDQENMDEGWGESCTGSITLTSDRLITCDEDIKTKEGYLIDMVTRYDFKPNKKSFKNFLKKFFPNGTPKFTVQSKAIPNEDEYHYQEIFVDGKLVGKKFESISIPSSVLEKTLNDLNPNNQLKPLDNSNMTTTNSLSAQSITDKILNAKGKFVKVAWKSNPKTAAAFKDFNLEKHTVAVCQAGVNYANLSSVKQGIESGERGEVQPLPWGEWLQFPYTILHKEETYLRLYPSNGLNHIPKSEFFVNNEKVDKTEFAKYLTPSEAKKLLTPTEEDRPLCFTIKANNVMDIPQDVEE